MIVRLILLVVSLVLAAALGLLAVSGAAPFSLPAGLFRGAAVSLPAYAAVLIAGVLGALLSVALLAAFDRFLTPPWEALVEQLVDELGLPIVTFAACWLFLVLPVAAATHRLALLPLTLALGAGCAAAMAARRAGKMLDDGAKLEVQHDILGIGGGLGGWRMSQAAGAALLSLVLLGVAVALSVASLPRSSEKTDALTPGAEKTGTDKAAGEKAGAGGSPAPAASPGTGEHKG